MRDIGAFFWGVMLLLAAGCGSLRKTWVCNDVEIGAEPCTKQKYAIKSLSVSFGGKCSKDAVTADAAHDGCQSQHVVSKEWVDCLYELYPKVFDREGAPVVLTAVQSNLPEGVPGFGKSRARSFLGKIGFLTLIPVIPVETDSAFRWRITLMDDNGLPLETSVDQVSEELGACSPLGLFCFYDPDGKGHVQGVSGIINRNGSEILRKQMEALGLSIASGLVKLESTGRIQPAQNKSADETPPPQAKADDVVRHLLETKRKELEDLKKAGIIDEAEYAAEVKKLAGAGK